MYAQSKRQASRSRLDSTVGLVIPASHVRLPNLLYKHFHEKWGEAPPPGLLGAQATLEAHVTPLGVNSKRG